MGSHCTSTAVTVVGVSGVYGAAAVHPSRCLLVLNFKIQNSRSQGQQQQQREGSSSKADIKQMKFVAEQLRRVNKPVQCPDSELNAELL